MRARLHALRPERDDPVSDSGLRRRSRLLVAVFAYPERGHGKGREQCGDGNGGTAEGLRVLGVGRQRLETSIAMIPRPPP